MNKLEVSILKQARYYWFSRRGGDEDEICRDSRFCDYLCSKNKFLLAQIEFSIYFSF